MNLREKQIYDIFLAATDEIIREKPDVLVHADDLFDTVKLRTRDYTTVPGALTRPAVLIRGIQQRISGKTLIKIRTDPKKFPIIVVTDPL